MTVYREVTVSDLRSSDVGKPVILTRDGVGFEGLLTGLDVTRSDYDFKDRPRVTARIVAKIFTDETSNSAHSEIQLKNLPMDYVVQVEGTNE